jgi:hypothetical protein
MLGLISVDLMQETLNDKDLASIALFKGNGLFKIE